MSIVTMVILMFSMDVYYVDSNALQTANNVTYREDA